MDQAYPVVLVIRNSEGEVRWMKVDFSAAADRWDEATKFLRNTFNVSS